MAPPPEQPPDPQYERLRRRFARRAGLVAGASALVTSIVLMAGSQERPVAALLGAMAPARSLTPVASGPCTRADLAKPTVKAMPVPLVVTEPLVIRPGPDVERLSPPRTSPGVSAALAWSLVGQRFSQPSTAGSVQVLLGELYAATPAVLAPGDPPKPFYTHTLVWAVFGVHQPEPPRAASEGDPPCYFESTVFYVDATTGRSLVAEVFPPDFVPAPAV